jgi:TrmH family RNA methyltransferase
MIFPPLSAAQQTRLRKLRQRKYRWLEQRFLVEGERGCEQILTNNRAMVEYMLVRADTDYLPGAPVRCFTVDAKLMAELTETETPPRVAALCQMPETASPENTTGAVVVCDALQDPGNVGTIMRTALWFGCNTVLAGRGTTDPFQPKVVRSTAGGIAAMHVAEKELPDGLQPWLNAGFVPFILDGGPASKPLNTVVLPETCLFIVGNEGNGIGAWAENTPFERLAIPGAGTLESLNAAVAVSIVLHAWFSTNRNS